MEQIYKLLQHFYSIATINEGAIANVMWSYSNAYKGAIAAIIWIIYLEFDTLKFISIAKGNHSSTKS